MKLLSKQQSNIQTKKKNGLIVLILLWGQLLKRLTFIELGLLSLLT